MRQRASFVEIVADRHLRRSNKGTVSIMKKFILMILAMTGLTLVFSQPSPLQPIPSDDAPELALLMGDLQRLTHKLALSAEAGNAELAAFYLHESQEQLRKIQTEAPEYENLPVALLIDRLAHPAYEPMQSAVTAKDAKLMREGVQAIVQACNACHTATQHAFIRITPGTEVNPFNQSFQP